MGTRVLGPELSCWGWRLRCSGRELGCWGWELGCWDRLLGCWELGGWELRGVGWWGGVGGEVDGRPLLGGAVWSVGWGGRVGLAAVEVFLGLDVQFVEPDALGGVGAAVVEFDHVEALDEVGSVDEAVVPVGRPLAAVFTVG